MKVVITGGGTGGHVFPGIAVAEALGRSAPDAEILFVGGSRGIEASAVPEAGYAFVHIPARGLLGKKIFAVPVVLWTTLRGLVASYRILAEFDPDVIFATGGYVSGAVALAGRLLQKPLVLHEQNSVPGLTNRMLSRVAQEVHLNLSSARSHFPKRRHLRLSGSPIRKGILEGDSDRARRDYGIPPGKAMILVLGGSQGARSINRASVAAVRALRRRGDLKFVLQTGQRDYRWVLRRLRGLKKEQVAVRPFIKRMGDAYSLADLVVARAGAMTLAEITACGKASILIPYPHATHNHQEINARTLVEVGASSMVADRDLRGDRLATVIAKLIDTPRNLREMSNNALTLARPDAAEKIAQALIRCSGGNGEVLLARERDERERPRRRGSRAGRSEIDRRAAGERQPRVRGRRGRRTR